MPAEGGGPIEWTPPYGTKDRRESGSGGQLSILPHCSHSLLRVRPGASDAPTALPT